MWRALLTAGSQRVDPEGLRMCAENGAIGTPQEADSYGVWAHLERRVATVRNHK